MSQTIRRKGKTARKSAVAQGNRARVQKAKKTTGSALDSVMAWLPFSEAQLHRIFLFAILAGGALALWIVAQVVGVPALAGDQISRVAADTGFEVKRVEVRGVQHIDKKQVYAIALAQEQNRAMPQVDIDHLREQLLALSWVKDARVSRQLPDTLVIDIVERTPHAVLRDAQGYWLIDETGHLLQQVDRRQAQGKLIVSGDGAGPQVVALSQLLDAAPALKPRVTEAEWVGDRRWNLTFSTGQVLALPEGDQESAAALVEFARLDGTNRLLGGKVAAFDMRAGDRMYMRVPGLEEQEAADKAAAAKAAKDAKASAKPAATLEGDD
ncbi:cell division protein FtsQ/DivIB [Novosphingobium sp. 9]|uniref:cell division protein FtsQ/DivIB n=1 Tax=Novosphingobium sp. 9 TaxID=2025349 RepID=UPI0021B5BFC1|nr:FtsQ-type POTRA domain-containing protein [Novosphingobium sp. 9]